MSNERKIHIDRLEIRMKGVPASTARGAAEGLGEDLARQLASGRLPGAARSARVDRIDAGEGEVSRGASAAELRRTIIRRIVDEIERKIT